MLLSVVGVSFVSTEVAALKQSGLVKEPLPSRLYLSHRVCVHIRDVGTLSYAFPAFSVVTRGRTDT